MHFFQQPLAANDITIGLYSEGGVPTDLADKLNASFPAIMGAGLGHRTSHIAAEADK